MFHDGLISTNRLEYLSQFSNAVLVGGRDVPCAENFNYERFPKPKNDLSGQRVVNKGEIKSWCYDQATSPSFALSNAVLFFKD